MSTTDYILTSLPLLYACQYSNIWHRSGNRLQLASVSRLLDHRPVHAVFKLPYHHLQNLSFSTNQSWNYDKLVYEAKLGGNRISLQKLKQP